MYHLYGPTPYIHTCIHADKMELVDSLTLFQWPSLIAIMYIYYLHLRARLVVRCGCGTFLRAWFPGVRYLEANLYWKVTLSGNEKRPLLGGCVNTTIMLNPIRNTTLVRGCPPLGGSIIEGSTVLL